MIFKTHHILLLFLVAILEVYSASQAKNAVDAWRLRTVDDELKKEPKFPKNDLKELRAFVASKPDLPEISDLRLIQFHFKTRYNLDNTKKVIQLYYDCFKEYYRDFFKNRRLSDPTVKAAKDIFSMYISPVRKNDTQIIFAKLIDADSSKYDVAGANKIFIMAMEASIWLYGTAEHTELVVDGDLFTFSHLVKIVGDMSTMRKAIRLDDSSPVRTKAIHIINAGSLVSRLFSALKLFISSELLEKVILYPDDDLSQFKRSVPAECLPLEYGGRLGPLATLDDKFVASMSVVEPIFVEEERSVAKKAKLV